MQPEIVAEGTDLSETSFLDHSQIFLVRQRIVHEKDCNCRLSEFEE